MSTIHDKAKACKMQDLSSPASRAHYLLCQYITPSVKFLVLCSCFDSDVKWSWLARGSWVVGRGILNLAWYGPTHKPRMTHDATQRTLSPLKETHAGYYTT